MRRLPSRMKSYLSPIGVLALSLSAAACTGVMDGANDMGAGGTNSTGGTNTGSTGTGGGSTIDPGKVTTEPVDPGRVEMHRLNSTEYNATVSDILGTTYQPADGNWRGGELGGFDNMAAVLGMDGDQFIRYFDAANKLVDEAFASEALRAKVMPCTTSDDACLAQILTTTGTRIFRRPLTQEELNTYKKVYDAGKAAGDDHATSVKTM